MSPVSRALSHETPPCGSRRTALAEIRKSTPCKANCCKTPCDQRFLTKALIARINPDISRRRPCQPPAAELAKPFHCMPTLDRWAPARCVRAPIRRVQKGLSEVGSILHHERERIRPSTL